MVNIGDVVQITGENGQQHWLRVGVLCTVVEVTPDDCHLVPLDPGPHNWLEDDDMGDSYVSHEDFRVLVSPLTTWRSIAQVEAFLSNTQQPPNGGNA